MASDQDDPGLRQLPSVDALLRSDLATALIGKYGRPRVLQWTRTAIEGLRTLVSANPIVASRAELLQQAALAVEQLATAADLHSLGPVLNLTGVVLHTNLGRAPLADRAIQAVEAAARFCNLEIDLATGERRYRGHQIEQLWRQLTGAEAALIVNNCAAATLLALQALAAGKEVIVSRGQLIEIGGAYRLPDVFRQSGATLVEVGTTNRTRLADYEHAIGPHTAGILRVHESNYRIVGFTESVPIGPLAELAHQHGLFAIDDVGSGALLDLRPYGLPEEPIVSASIAAGADLVLFSGDKLLGGPQCGVLLGKTAMIEKVKKSPLARALRIDKLTLAALQATLEIHLEGRAIEEIPVLAQLTISADALRSKAESIWNAAQAAGVRLTAAIQRSTSAVGGGSLPAAELPTWVIALQPAPHSADELARQLRVGTPRVLTRVQNNAVLLDVRTLLPGQESLLIRALQS